MQITINLCSTPYLDLDPLLRKLRISVICLASATVCAGSLLVFMHFNRNVLQAEEQQLDATITRQSDQLITYRKMLDKPENVSIASRALALNSLFDEKSFSWTMLMKDFEGLVPAEVQLATIQPVREKDGSISIRMHVVGPHEKVIDLIHALELSKSFTQPHVTAESSRSDGRPSQHATAMTAASVEEFDILAGYEESLPLAAQPANPAFAERATEAAVLTGSEPSKTPPLQMSAGVGPASPVHSGGTR